jgi:hypothetical protein
MIEEINFGLDKTRRFLDMILKYGAEKWPAMNTVEKL